MRRVTGLVCAGWIMFAGCQKPNEASDELAAQRNAMVQDQIVARGARAGPVLEAMRQVPRHLFVPDEEQRFAYADTPLPIGYGQTISQPFIVAAMTEMLEVGPDDTVLEIGTGSGYQAAVLAHIVRRVYTIEIVEPLAVRAEKTLSALGYTNVNVRAGDGYVGWPEHAPFDGIMVTAGAEHVPQPLIDQLRVGARMVIPVGETLQAQELRLLKKNADGSLSETSVMPVRFVPLTGEHTSFR